MTENTSEQEAKRWKRQYYDHLDLLDEKEKHWQSLESILIKAVLRLSLAAEGQHASIDKHLMEIRSEAKGQINVIRFGTILDEISALLLKVGSKQAGNKKVITTLIRLLEDLDFPGSLSKQKKKLLKKLVKSTDDNSVELTEKLQRLLSESLQLNAGGVQEKAKSGWFDSLFGSKRTTDTSESASDVAITDSVTIGIARITESLPWPDELVKDAELLSKKLRSASHENIDKHIDQLDSLIQQWQPNVVSLADEKTKSESSDRTIDMTLPEGATRSDDVIQSSAEGSEPSVKEILVRLLEQLMVTPDLLDQVDRLKQRIVDESSIVSWKQLLRDVAQLINVLRSRMQEEKQEFESFLQQITGRLKEMDGFLAIETASLNEAEQAGESFDVVVNAQVQDIHDDMTSANDLQELKNKVEKRLNVVSDHIKQYRVNEHHRFENAQQNLESLQSRMVLLERESGDLRKLIVEKNREAMFDALTGVPNRLSYEKKAAEEIARCNRFDTGLCMVVWDIDKFKLVNDTYGHKVGDKVLKVVAQLLNDRIRETDFLARYGGEEFVMFLPAIDEAEALKVADGLREKVAASTFKNDDEIIKITLSCGISCYAVDDSHEAMFERADKALYKAKHHGRNQCVIYS